MTRDAETGDIIEDVHPRRDQVRRDHGLRNLKHVTDIEIAIDYDHDTCNRMLWQNLVASGKSWDDVEDDDVQVRPRRETLSMLRLKHPRGQRAPAANCADLHHSVSNTRGDSSSVWLKKCDCVSVVSEELVNDERHKICTRIDLPATSRVQMLCGQCQERCSRVQMPCGQCQERCGIVLDSNVGDVSLSFVCPSPFSQVISVKSKVKFLQIIWRL